MKDFVLQIRGHRRSPSDSRAFRERTKRDALLELKKDLERIESTAPDEYKEEFHEEFAGFERLFNRFLQEEGPSLEWERIQKLPEGSVRMTK